MKRMMIALAAFVVITTCSVSALAVQFWTYDLAVGCNGWASNVEIWFREGYTDASLEWTAGLFDAGGTEVERWEGSQIFPAGYSGFVAFTYGESFAGPVIDGWTVQVDYVLYDSFTDGHNAIPLTLAAAADCTGGPTEVCCRTAGWWHRNPETWPVTSMAVGGRDFDAALLQRALGRPTWGNLGMVLVRQMVAARFNAIANPSVDMTAALETADAYLASATITGFGDGAVRKPPWVTDPATAQALITPLVDFNHHGCPTDRASSAHGQENLPYPSGSAETGPSDNLSFGALKARFR